MATIEIRGLPDLLRKLDATKLAGKPATNFLNRWRFSTEADAKRGAPVWKGLTRQSITSEIDDGAFPRSARVGSNLDQARWAEYGTGLLSEDPESAHRRYFPPPAALDAWAIGHGFLTGSVASAKRDAESSPGTYGYLVALAIYIQGGTKPHPYLRPAVQASEAKLPQFLGLMAREIETEAAGA